MYTDEKQPGFKNVILKPDFVKGLNSFEASHKGPYGMIVSSWKRSGKKIEYKVTIPPNSTAELSLKGAKILEGGRTLSDNKAIKIVKVEGGLSELNLKSGSYSFSIK